MSPTRSRLDTARFDLPSALAERRTGDGTPAGIAGACCTRADLFDRATAQALAGAAGCGCWAVAADPARAGQRDRGADAAERRQIAGRVERHRPGSGRPDAAWAVRGAGGPDAGRPRGHLRGRRQLAYARAATRRRAGWRAYLAALGCRPGAGGGRGSAGGRSSWWSLCSAVAQGRGGLRAGGSGLSRPSASATCWPMPGPVLIVLHPGHGRAAATPPLALVTVLPTIATGPATAVRCGWCRMTRPRRRHAARARWARARVLRRRLRDFHLGFDRAAQGRCGRAPAACPVWSGCQRSIRRSAAADAGAAEDARSPSTSRSGSCSSPWRSGAALVVRRARRPPRPRLAAETDRPQRASR